MTCLGPCAPRSKWITTVLVAIGTTLMGGCFADGTTTSSDTLAAARGHAPLEVRVCPDEERSDPDQCDLGTTFFDIQRLRLDLRDAGPTPTYRDVLLFVPIAAGASLEEIAATPFVEFPLAPGDRLVSLDDVLSDDGLFDGADDTWVESQSGIRAERNVATDAGLPIGTWVVAVYAVFDPEGENADPVVELGNERIEIAPTPFTTAGYQLCGGDRVRCGLDDVTAAHPCVYVTLADLVVSGRVFVTAYRGPFEQPDELAMVFSDSVEVAPASSPRWSAPNERSVTARSTSTCRSSSTSKAAGRS